MGLKDKAARIDFASLGNVAAPPATGESSSGGARPKTAPGLLMAQTGDQRSELVRENQELKSRVEELSNGVAQVQGLQEELKTWDGAKAARLIDPKLIVRSRWANRDRAHFSTPAFDELKGEIELAGGNVQPIKVRPLPVTGDGGEQYEVVFGHRRHEACQQLGLPVFAVVDNLDDRSLFVEMDRENRSRKDLSAWEQGVMYRRALADGLFVSNRKLAEAVDADLTNVGRALALADLPKEIVAAFASPLDLQFRWARPLSQAWEADAEEVKKRLAALGPLASRAKPKVIFEQLVGRTATGDSTVLPPPERVEVKVGTRRVAIVELDARGRAKIVIEAGLVKPTGLAELAGQVERFLANQASRER